jgi:hypothetical protein
LFWYHISNIKIPEVNVSESKGKVIELDVLRFKTSATDTSSSKPAVAVVSPALFQNAEGDLVQFDSLEEFRAANLDQGSRLAGAFKS